MKTMDVKTRIGIKNIAFATDRSPESYAALPWAAEFCALLWRKDLGLSRVIAERLPRASIFSSADPGRGLEGSGEGTKKAIDETSCRCAPRSCDLSRRDMEHLFLFHRKEQFGVRKPEGSVRLATHFARATAYKVVSEANCPVLTVRG